MKITEPQLHEQLDNFGEHRIQIVVELAHEGRPDGIGPALMLAIGSRESGLTNVVGDAGHGRGYLQIDDRSHTAFLASHPGCKPGLWKPQYKSADPPGRAPTLTAATLYAIGLLRGNAAFAQHRVPQQEVMRFAIAAYNCGAGNALKSHQQGNVDARTAGRDYSADVLDRSAHVAAYLKARGLA